MAETFQQFLDRINPLELRPSEGRDSTDEETVEFRKMALLNKIDMERKEREIASQMALPHMEAHQKEWQEIKMQEARINAAKRKEGMEKRLEPLRARAQHETAKREEAADAIQRQKEQEAEDKRQTYLRAQEHDNEFRPPKPVSASEMYE